MRKHKKSIFLNISLLAVVLFLLSNASPGFAQDDQGWSKPVNLSRSGLATNPMLVIDFRNVLHAIWVDNVDGYKYSQSADGITWTAPQTVKFPFDKKGFPPVMIADANGSIHIFWIDSAANLFYVQTTSSDLANPSNWQVTTRLSRNVLSYDVILDSRGILHLAYIRNASTEISPAGVYYSRSIVGGGSWSESIELYESEYFRSTKPDEANVRIAVSNSASTQKVYVTWDSRSQKRVFMAVSNDSGTSWGDAQQIKGPEDTGGIDAPFNLNVASSNNKVLIMWQVGEPGSAKCSVFSQASEDGGANWGDVISVSGGLTDCPTSSKFLSQNDNYMVTILNGVGDPTLMAWNGSQWSDPQPQTQLPAFSNPLTFDAILLGCRYDLISQNRLYVVGCDQGKGGDVWFLTRPLEPVENWFSPPTIWGGPVTISGKDEKISSLLSAADAKGNIHSVWVQSAVSNAANAKTSIEYTRWNGKELTNPEAVISSLDGIPLQMAINIDSQERILLSWVNGNSGDLLFSWANLDRANLASEWETPVSLPSVSNLNESPDIVVGGSGRIVIAYAVPLNENRGIYIVQSTDSGKTWSSPIQVFDAVSAEWEKVGNPKIGLSADGVLHLIFSRNSVRKGQPVGLYYSRSVDGGITWSDAQILSEGDIQWSDIACYDNSTVHVLWQEYDGLVFANLSQLSQDSGISWSRPFDVTGVNDVSTPVALAAKGIGQLHFVQLLKDNNATTIEQDNLILQDWKWTGSNWEFASSSDVIIEGKGLDYSLAAGITSDGYLGVSVSTEYSDPENNIRNEILNFNRFLKEANTDIVAIPTIASIPTPMLLSGATEVPNVSPTQYVDLSALSNDNVPTTPLQRNIVGVVIVGVALIVIMLLLMRGRSRK